MSALRVAYVITRADAIGGAHVHVRDVAKAAAARGHECTVIVGGEGPYTAALRDAGIGFISVPSLVREISPSCDIRAAREVTKALGELRPDIVSCHSTKAGVIGRLAATRLGIPVIFTAHGWAFTEGVAPALRPAYVLAERAMAKRARKIIAVSDYDRELAVRLGVCERDRIVTIHNGMPDVDATLRARPGSEPTRIICVARFEKQKDHLLLMRALGDLRDLEWELDLVGDGPLRERCEIEARRRGIHERVRFLGARRDVADLLARAHLFVLPSRWEGFPRSILEAMRAGLPVVASDVGGCRESVDHRKSGLIVERGDQDSMRAALERMLRASAERERFGAAGRERYEREFTFERMFTRTLGVYEEVRAQGVA